MLAWRGLSVDFQTHSNPRFRSLCKTPMLVAKAGVSRDPPDTVHSTGGSCTQRQLLEEGAPL